jgi:hypothetical protein
VWLGILPLSLVAFVGLPLWFGWPLPGSLWTIGSCLLTWSILLLFMAYTAPRSVKRLAAELCEAGTWKASGTGFSGRIGTDWIVDTWARENTEPFNNLMLECPTKLGFAIENTSTHDPTRWIVQKFGVTQFGLFEKLPRDGGDEYDRQTDDLGAFIALMENARFTAALATLEKIPSFRCLLSLRVPGRVEVVMKAWMLGSLSGREGLVLVRMVDSPRGAAAIRQDLTLLREIRSAITEAIP